MAVYLCLHQARREEKRAEREERRQERTGDDSSDTKVHCFSFPPWLLACFFSFAPVPGNGARVGVALLRLFRLRFRRGGFGFSIGFDRGFFRHRPGFVKEERRPGRNGATTRSDTAALPPRPLPSCLVFPGGFRGNSRRAGVSFVSRRKPWGLWGLPRFERSAAAGARG